MLDFQLYLSFCNKTPFNPVKQGQIITMRNINIVLFLSLFVFTPNITAQLNSPDDFISYVRDKGNGFALTLPGWFVRAGGNLASKDMDETESAAIKELLGHIKKLRLVFTEEAPSEFQIDKKELSSAMKEKNYESLVQVRGGEANVDLWAKIDSKDVVKDIFLSVFEDKNISMIKIKTDLDLTQLQNMEFFKELQNEARN